MTITTMKGIIREPKALLYVGLIFLLVGCGEKFPVIDSFKKEYPLVDQNSKQIKFPELIKGKVSVVGYIFTNCPDICPLTTNNMRLIQQKLKQNKINNVEFVSISFDPMTDTPEVLRKYAEIRNLDLSNWEFLTGNKTVIDSLIKHAGVFAVPSDSTTLSNGKIIHYYIHTDRIQLVDEDGNIRKNYPGSKVNIDEIVEDIKTLSN